MAVTIVYQLLYTRLVRMVTRVLVIMYGVVRMVTRVLVIMQKYWISYKSIDYYRLSTHNYLIITELV